MDERLKPLRSIEDWEGLEDCSVEAFELALDEEMEKWQENGCLINLHMHVLKAMIEGGWDRLDVMEVVIENGQFFTRTGEPGPYPVNGFPDFRFLDHATPDQRRLLEKYGAKPGQVDSEIAYADLLKDHQTISLWQHIIDVNAEREPFYDEALMLSLIQRGASVTTHFYQSGIEHLVLDDDFWRSHNMCEFVIDRDILKSVFNVADSEVETLYWNNVLRTKMITARYPNQREKSLAMITEAMKHGADANMRLSAHLIDRETKQISVEYFTLLEALEGIAGSETTQQAIKERLDSLRS